MTCEGLGMPFHKMSYKHGNLFINFTIKFPDSINDAQMTQVKEVLKGQAKSAAEQREVNEVEEKVQLSHFEEHHKNTHA
jgi:DnaJ-class molecular chaperone